MTRFTSFIVGIFLVIACFGVSTHAYAQEIETLTEQNVKEFIEKTTAIMSRHDVEMNDGEIVAYLNAHLHPDARFKSTMRYAIPGFEVQEKVMSVEKDDFIKGVEEASNTVSGYKSVIEVSDVQISKDGKKATVKTRTIESGIMPVADEIEKEEVPMEGMSSCTQILMLSTDNIIQMYNATCVTDISFQVFEP